MLRTLSSLVLLFSVCCPDLLAENKSPKYKAGNGYELVQPVQPTQDQAKVEIIEFFWYGCPHCYRFEPYLSKWLSDLPDNVQYIRQPAIFGPRWSMHAKAYFTAEALDIVDKVHADLFDSIQNKKQPLESEDELLEFFGKHGVSETQFRKAFNSFIVDTKMRQASSISVRYGIKGVPAVIINGKFRTGASIAKGFGQVIDVMNFLIAQESSNLQ